ncbi:alpha-lytic protease prodomain-containing protein [Saccharothrix sp. 6-C]|uniref:alpha-lytic protease prodomain-containing protein n=1 Tax=Saccharothrix sp. 6-C TaxID=2781735 RepID=UPI0019176A72|nr:alpha-lytic protease prodomain-containing protein [Saccharothrix sp. 6-C]QQQ77070.1 alpha-lytic protease prodomain-containing protein [Saccharothrix sp. 6-C]
MTRRTVAAVAVAVLSAAGLAAALATTATAGPPPPRTDVDGGMVAALARDLHLTPDQARARIQREAVATRTESTLKARLGPGFAGAWLNADATELVVGVTAASQIQAVEAEGARPALVARSLAQLDALKAKLDRNARSAPRGVPGWYVDAPTNTVVVLARDVTAAKAFARTSGLGEADVRIERSTEDPRPLADVIGGNAYYIGSGSRCSVGFAVQGGFVTAGHCGSTGASTTQPSGTFAGSSFPGNDYAWVRTAAGNTGRGLVNRYPGTVPVAGSTEAPVGASVCRSGSTTGWRCGTIQQKNTSVTYPEGTITGLTRTNACAEPGDSGGSWLTGDQAQGVTSGGSGNCTSGGTIYFQPVNEILQVYGLQLIVSGGTPTSTTSPTTTTTTDPGQTTWQPGVAYTTGSLVTYDGVGYRCLQGHTSQPGWDPPAVPALWERV